MYCGAGTVCCARRATAGVGWFACPGVDRAPIVIKAKRSRQAFTNELRNCIARSPVEEVSCGQSSRRESGFCHYACAKDKLGCIVMTNCANKPHCSQAMSSILLSPTRHAP